ncbi:MAG: GspH/FimT family pseudopilin [Candidatus Competibacteraceae bacterium]|nr:GspH/FimT family pseudopilin [Candidatus Competibacteraceae bacterium]
MNRQRGFTLIELIITMAIAAIVLTVGVPSFQAMMRNNRAATYTNQFMSALNLARSEAIKRGWRVVLCPGNQAGCNGNAWGNGWIVFIDADANGNNFLDELTNNNGQWDNGEVVLRVYDAFDGGRTTLTGNAPTNPPPNNQYISFSPDGATRLLNNFPLNCTLTLSLCHNNNQQNQIRINVVGRARVNTDLQSNLVGAPSCTF